MAANTKVIRIEIDGFPDDAYDVVSFRGSESISGLFRYHITLASQAPTQDFDAILEAKAHLILGDPAMHVRGILCSVQQGYEAAWKSESGALTRVDVVLVPDLYKLSLTSRTRIFQELSVPDIVKKILNEAGIPGDETDWKLSASYDPKEFVLQFQESDLDFIQRLLDYEGIHYHLDLGEDATKIVFGDSNSAFVAISGDSTVRLGIPDPELGDSGVGAWGHEQTLTRFQSRQRIVPKKVVLQDYNFQKSSLNLKVEGEVKAPKATLGMQYFYGEDYKVQEEGKAITKIRTEEILSRKRLFFGGGTVRRFYAGSTFTLTGVDEIDTELAKEYLITEVTSEGSQPVEHVGGARTYHYSNEFTCLDKEAVEYRPERRTPWPQIGGVLHAKVCAAPGGGQYAHVDDRGRYKVRFLFDIDHSGDDDKASCWVRKVESYVGKDFGFHAPLLKDFEVLIAFENCDPNRPIMIGSAYNTDFPSPVKDKNHAQSVWRSAANNEIRYDDTSGSEEVYFHAQKNSKGKVENDAEKLIGNDEKLEVKNNRERKVGVDEKIEIGSNREIKIGANLKEEVGGDTTIKVTGNHTEQIDADMKLTIAGASVLSVAKDVEMTLDANKTETVKADVKQNYQANRTTTVTAKDKLTVSGDSDTTVSGEYKVKVTGEVKIENDGDLSIKSMGEGEIDALKEITLSAIGDTTVKSVKGVEINGTAGVEVKSRASIEIEASGQVKIKGAKVDIMDGALTAM